MHERTPGSLTANADLKAGSKITTVNGQEIVIDGDIITTVNGQPVARVDELRANLEQLPTNHPLALMVLRDEKETQLFLAVACTFDLSKIISRSG